MFSKGDLLVSDLSLAEDLVFRRSVVLICDLDENKNPMGFILNKPLEINLSNIISEVKKSLKYILADQYQGIHLFCIHKTNLKLKYSIQITKDLSYGFDLDEVIKKTENGELNKNNLMIFLGYSGWSNHQLYNELNENCWKINKDYSKNIFKNSKENLWKKLTKKIEGESYIWYNAPENLRDN